ncbi:MAG: hypothetical protein Athens071426_47 [Parcubacteria group bacterium Athens0714_26]|nr:MAG: hypothetical protein Athens101426_558 [Parcubacteria group bacterium Athens1014_26]TSD03765.1 MAG: hypothetical protein Athens071426_47 [Parcubacteria group bacterium Athens0714_26]
MEISKHQKSRIIFVNPNKAQRRTAIQAAWTKFRTSRISATQTLRQERLEAWKQFRIDRGACGSGPTGEDPAVDMTL